jgi:hypothetical protein
MLTAKIFRYNYKVLGIINYCIYQTRRQDFILLFPFKNSSLYIPESRGMHKNDAVQQFLGQWIWISVSCSVSIEYHVNVRIAEKQ